MCNYLEQDWREIWVASACLSREFPGREFGAFLQEALSDEAECVIVKIKDRRAG